MKPESRHLAAMAVVAVALAACTEANAQTPEPTQPRTVGDAGG